jgi:hypothetical protein
MLADKDKQIEGLNRRLVAVDEERRTTLRLLTELLTDQRERPIITPAPPPARALKAGRWSRFRNRPVCFSSLVRWSNRARSPSSPHGDHRGDEADTAHRLKGITTGAIDQVGTISTNAASRGFTCSAAPLAALSAF